MYSFSAYTAQHLKKKSLLQQIKENKISCFPADTEKTRYNGGLSRIDKTIQSVASIFGICSAVAGAAIATVADVAMTSQPLY